MLASTALHLLIDLVPQHVPQQAPPLPNPAPVAPAGVEKLNGILANIKFIALMAAVAGFFAGLIVFSVGRIVDHRRAGSTGSMMIISSLGVALLFGLGPQLIQSFATG